MVHKVVVAASLVVAATFALLAALASVAAVGAMDGPTRRAVSAGAAVLLFASAGLAIALLIGLASSWGRLVGRWREAERVLAQALDAVSGGWDTGSGRTAYVVLGLFMAVTIGAGTLQAAAPAIDAAQSNTSASLWSSVNDYWEERHWFLFRWVRYRSWTALAFVILEIAACSILTIVDLVLIELGRALAGCFQRLNSTLRQQCGKALPPRRWEQLREAYVALSDLASTVDKHVARLLLLALTVDLSFVCIALYQGQQLQSSHWCTLLSYSCSFLLLATRTLVLLICVSDVNERSRVAVREVFCCPAHNYCVEVERLIRAATSDNVALTGLQLFAVTRSFMLGVLGAVITFQVLLIQA